MLILQISRKKVSFMKTPLTKKKIQHHLSYSLWKYVLLAVIAAFGWNIVFSVTRYHPPEEKKVVLGVYAFGSDININTYMEQVRVDLMPDMEEMNAMFIMPDEAQGAMILTTRIAARDCDIYILPRAQFQSYASTGAFMPLDIVLPDLLTALEAEGVSLSRGYRTLEDKAPAPWNESTASGEKHQYAIPCADLPGMSAMLQCDASDMYIGIFFETGNDDNVCKFFSQFVRDMLQEPVVIELPAE